MKSNAIKSIKAPSRPWVCITGASSGIGRSCAEQLAAAGYPLILLARRLPRLKQLAQQLKSAHAIEVHTFAIDLMATRKLHLLLAKQESLFSKVGILINNAGLARGKDLIHEGKLEDWQEMIDTNIKALLVMTRQLLPAMVKRGQGHIINIGSIAGRQTYRAGNVYCATKAAVRTINHAIRLDVHGTGVRVSSVDPGMVETEFSQVRFHGNQEKAAAVYRGLKALTADDVAEAVLWCISRPMHVNIEEILITPTVQASVDLIARD